MLDKKTLETLVKEDDSFREVAERAAKDPNLPEDRLFLGNKQGKPFRYVGKRATPDMFRHDLYGAAGKVHEELTDYVGDNLNDFVSESDTESLLSLANHVLDPKISAYARILYSHESGERTDKMISELAKSGDATDYFIAGSDSDGVEKAFREYVDLEIMKIQRKLGDVTNVGGKEIFVLNREKVLEYFENNLNAAEKDEKNAGRIRDALYTNIAHSVLDSYKQKEKAKAN